MRKLLAKIRKILRDRRTRRFLTRFVSGAAAIVVFVTTYALVLPAITMEKEANCGIEAHQHDDSCYTGELSCDIPESGGHHHDESCYSITSTLICGMDEHEHSVETGCYDEDGNLICEKKEHRHNDECYEETRELTCQIPESESHQHTDACYEKVLTCGKEVHVHSTACYDYDPVSDSAVAASTSSASAATTSAGSVSSAGMTLSFVDETVRTVGTDEQAAMDQPVDNDRAIDNNGFVDNGGLGETDGSSGSSEIGGLSETDRSSETASSGEGNTEVPMEMTYGSENAGTGSTDASNAALTNADNSASALTSSTAADQYIPLLEAVDFNTVLNDRTGIYYHHVADGETVEDSSAIPAEDWNRIPNNTDNTDLMENMDDVELGGNDLLRVYLSYTIPAGSLNATNPVARYRLPSNLHLTDSQVKAINENVNGLAGQYVDLSTLEITDPDMYNAYLGAEAVEGTRRPDEAVEDYLAEQARKAGTDPDDAAEYISAVARVENVYDADGIYGEKDAYLGQDLIFTFAPYSIEKNQHEYDSTGKPTKAGEEIKGWLTLDLNMGQVDFEKPEITTSTVEVSNEDNLHGDSESKRSEDENTEENHTDNFQTEDDHREDDFTKEGFIKDDYKDENSEENHSVNNTVDNNTADNESSVDGKTIEKQSYTITFEHVGRTAEIIFVEEGWDKKGKKINPISTTLTAAEETVLEAQNDDTLEDDEDSSVNGEKEKLVEKNKVALSDETTADENVKDPMNTEQVILPAMSFSDSIRVSTGKPAGIDENAGGFLANAAESLPEEAEISVRVEADEGTFPAGTTMVLSAVDQSSYDNLAETLVETVESGDTSNTDTSGSKADGQQAKTDNVEDKKTDQNTVKINANNNTSIKTYGFQAVDITFLDKEGNEIEPVKPVRVALTSTVVEQAREKAEDSAIADPVVVHVDNEGKAEQMDLVSPEKVEPAKGRSEEELLEEDEKKTESGKTDDTDNVFSADDTATKKNVEHEAHVVGEDGDKGGSADFTAGSFSVYAIVYTVELYTNVITDSGETYRITVTYDETSGIPQDAELKVKEITEGDKGYENYYEEAVKAASNSSDAHDDVNNKEGKRVNPDKTYARFFDIEIWAKGEKAEPAGDVSVSIRLLDVPETDDRNVIKIVHFAKDDTEIIPYTTDKDDTENIDSAEDRNNKQTDNDSKSSMEFNFTASSFSVYSVVSYTVDFHWEVDGKTYEFSLPGGGFVSLEHLVEVLGIAYADVYAENGHNYEEEAPATGTAIRLNEVEVSSETKAFVANVEYVEFSNPSLVWVGRANTDSSVGTLKVENELKVEYSAELTEEQVGEINAQAVEAGDWALISLQPFTSNEILTITMADDEVFVIRVTDAQLQRELTGKTFLIKTAQNNNSAYGMSATVFNSQGRNYLTAKKPASISDNGQLWTFEYSGLWGDTYRLKSVSTGQYIRLGSQDGKSMSLTSNANDAALFYVEEENGLYRLSTYPNGTELSYLNFYIPSPCFTMNTQTDVLWSPNNHQTWLYFEEKAPNNYLPVRLHFVKEDGTPISGVTYVNGETVDGDQVRYDYLLINSDGTIDLSQFVVPGGVTLSNTHRGTWEDILRANGTTGSYISRPDNGANAQQPHSIIGNELRLLNGQLQYRAFYTHNDKAGWVWMNAGYRPGVSDYEYIHGTPVQDNIMDYYLVYSSPEYSINPDDNLEIQAPDLGVIGRDKKLSSNYDGTYNLELSVSTVGQKDKVSNKANVIFVVDYSSSMRRNQTDENQANNYMNNSNSRIYQTKTKLTQFINQLMEFNGTGHEDTVEFSFVTFNKSADIKKEWTTQGSDITNLLNNDYTGSGTNWAEAIEKAKTLVGQADNDPTYVLFLTDGAPSQYWDTDTYGNYTNNLYVEGWGSYLGARDEARDLASTGAYLYGVFSYGTATDEENDYLGSFVDYAYNQSGAKNDFRFFARDGNALEKKLNRILSVIGKSLGYTNVDIYDGITELTTVTFQDADPESFEYTITYRDYTSPTEYEEKEVPIIVTGTGNNQVITIPEGLTYHAVRNGELKEFPVTPATIKGAVFTTADQSPTHEKNVEWKLQKTDGSPYMTEQGWTYKVKFKIWPSQPSYDIIAALNNGVNDPNGFKWGQTFTYTTPSGQTGSISFDEYRSQIDLIGSTYVLKTNTNTSVKYKEAVGVTSGGNTTYTEGDSKEVGLPEVGGMPLDNTYIMLQKVWNTTLTSEDYDKIDSVDLYVLQDNPEGTGFNKADPSTYFQKVTLTRDNGWQAMVSIAPGVYDQRGHMNTTGHTYSVKEPDIDGHFELEATPTHPMLNGLTHVSTDPNTIKDMVDVYGYNTSSLDVDDEDTYPPIYEMEDQVNKYKVANTLKAGINISKELVDLPSQRDQLNMDEYFTVFVSLEDEEGNPVTAETYGEGSVAYRIYAPGDKIPAGATVVPEGATGNDIVSYTINGLTYQAEKSGGVITDFWSRGVLGSDGTVTLKIRECDTLRIVNVPMGTTYTVREIVDSSSDFSYKETYWEVRKEDAVYDGNTTTVTTNTIEHTIVPDAENNVVFRNRPKKDLTIQKTGVNEGGLPGAVFQLMAKNASDVYQPLAELEGFGCIRIDDDSLTTVTIGGVEQKSTFTTTGVIQTLRHLPDGEYKLVEVKAPAGYLITLSEIEFTVTGGAVTMGTQADTITYSATPTAGNAELSIANIPGAALPNTGGLGTRLFTILGTILIAGAGVLFWMRRRLI